jgi:hypothetical protein
VGGAEGGAWARRRRPQAAAVAPAAIAALTPPPSPPPAALLPTSPVPLKVVASSLDSLRAELLQDFSCAADLRECLKASAQVPEIAGAPRLHRGHRCAAAGGGAGGGGRGRGPTQWLSGPTARLQLQRPLAS